MLCIHIRTDRTLFCMHFLLYLSVLIHNSHSFSIHPHHFITQIGNDTKMILVQSYKLRNGPLLSKIDPYTYPLSVGMLELVGRCGATGYWWKCTNLSFTLNEILRRKKEIFYFAKLSKALFFFFALPKLDDSTYFLFCIRTTIRNVNAFFSALANFEAL